MNVLTFDIEDWFHLLDVPGTSSIQEWRNFESRLHANVDKLLETLQRHELQATFFCLGWVADHYPGVIRSIDALGYEIASHSYSHQLVYQQSPSQFREDIDRSVKVLEDTIGKKVKTFRAPGFSIKAATPWAFESLIELGIMYDSSVFPARRGHGGFAEFGTAQPTLITCRGGNLRELPINLGTLLGKQIVFSGGGYFRLLPYSVLQHLTKQSDYVMTYFHPRDFDPEQPRLKLPLHRRFKSYVGLKSSYAKFERWLDENAFVDISTASNLIDWDNVPRIII